MARLYVALVQTIACLLAGCRVVATLSITDCEDDDEDTAEIGGGFWVTRR